MKSIKKFGLLGIVFFGLTTNGFCGGYPVIDITAILGQIELTYQTYEQVMNTVEQVKAAYQRIQQACDAVKNFSLDDIKDAATKYGESWKNINSWEALMDKDKVLATRDALKNMLKTSTKTVEDLQKNIKATWQTGVTAANGRTYSLGSLLGFSPTMLANGGGTIFDLAADMKDAVFYVGNKTSDYVTDQLSFEEKKAMAKEYMGSSDLYVDSRMRQEMAYLGLSNLIGKEASDNIVDENGKPMSDWDLLIASASGAVSTSDIAEDSTLMRMDATTQAAATTAIATAKVGKSWERFASAYGITEVAKATNEKNKEIQAARDNAIRLADKASSGRNQAESACYY